MAAIRIDDKAFADSRFTLLAKLLGYAEPDFAIIKVARIWQLQTETFTPENPTYVVSTSIVTAMLGPSVPESLVLAKLATEQPGGLYIHGTRGRIEWLHASRARAVKAGKASGESRRAKMNTCSTDVEHMFNTSSTYVEHSPNIRRTRGEQEANIEPTKSNPLSLSLSLSLSDSQKEEGETPFAACAAPSNPADAAEGSGGPQNPTAPAQAPSRSRKAVGTAASGLLLPLPGPGSPQEKTAATAQPIASGEVSQKRTGPARKAPLPADWVPGPELCAMAAGLGVDPQRAADSMRDWAAANAERKADWDATFRNWVRRDQQFKRAPVLPQPRVTRPYELPPPGQATPPSPPKKREPIPF